MFRPKLSSSASSPGSQSITARRRRWKTPAYLVVAVGLIVAGRLAYRSESPLSTVDAGPTPILSASEAERAPAQVPVRILRPPRSSAEFGILTSRMAEEIRAWTDHRERLAESIAGRLCGDADACEAVRNALRDEHTTSLQVMAASDWNLGRLDVDASGAGLTPGERRGLLRRTQVVAVSTSAATSDRQLALRTAIAGAAALAEQFDGWVHDPLLLRIERAKDFAAHAVVVPLGAPTFRRDRVEVLYEPTTEGVVRVLTAGLSRWGAPDVEAANVPVGARARVAELVLAVAEEIANGDASGTLRLGPDDLVRAAGVDRSSIEPEASPLAIPLLGVHPESGDPNDFMVRIVPPDGEGPMGYLQLAEHFFGRVLGVSTETATVNEARRDDARRDLDEALARWQSIRANGGAVLVRLPFAIPGDAGSEAMWVEVKAFDRGTVTGTLVDEPLAAVSVEEGAMVSRRRDEVEAVEVRAER